MIVAGHIVVDPQQRESYLAGCVSVVELARRTTGCLDSLSPRTWRIPGVSTSSSGGSRRVPSRRSEAMVPATGRAPRRSPPRWPNTTSRMCAHCPERSAVTGGMPGTLTRLPCPLTNVATERENRDQIPSP